ncbi:MAG: type II 3-dehydroquinate dehydratase [Deltaproteobacteria bacterium]|nr:type II 3-dehydroquinate dehydratase [Candidatus Zymogenaceae bacterium]
MNVLIINGPNLNMLGKREPEIYGSFTYDDLVSRIKDAATNLGIQVDVFQSNVEGEIVDRIQSSERFDGIVINAGAYTHTSIAIRDALLVWSSRIPVIEVHLTNIFGREEFRKHSYISDIARGVIAGLGVEGYVLALSWIAGETPGDTR